MKTKLLVVALVSAVSTISTLAADAQVKPSRPAKTIKPIKPPKSNPTRVLQPASKISKATAPIPYIAHKPGSASILSQIVVQYDAATGTGFDWGKKGALTLSQ